MPVCMVLVELAITCEHDCMVVTVKMMRSINKLNFNRWSLAITALPTTLTSKANVRDACYIGTTCKE